VKPTHGGRFDRVTTAVELRHTVVVRTRVIEGPAGIPATRMRVIGSGKSAIYTSQKRSRIPMHSWKVMPKSQAPCHLAQTALLKEDMVAAHLSIGLGCSPSK